MKAKKMAAQKRYANPIYLVNFVVDGVLIGVP